MSNQLEMNLRDQGMTLSALNNLELLSLCRRRAEEIAKAKGSVSIDDVREDLGLVEVKNWAGSVFRGPQWVCVGMVQARHKGSHARRVMKWQLK